MSDLAVTRAGSGYGRTALVLAVASLLLYIGGGFAFGGVFWVLGPVVGVGAIVLGVAARRNGGGREATTRSSSPRFPSSGSPLSWSSQHSTETASTDSAACRRWSWMALAVIGEHDQLGPLTTQIDPREELRVVRPIRTFPAARRSSCWTLARRWAHPDVQHPEQ